MLSDDEKRSLYDRFGEPGLQGEYGAGPKGVSTHFFCSFSMTAKDPSLMLVHA